MTENLKTNWTWRLLGVAVVLLCVVLYDPAQGGLLQQLLLPVVMGISAIFIVQNVLSVMLAGTLLAGIHSHWSLLSLGLATKLTSDAWIEGFAYPAITILCFLVAGAILLQRFRQHIRSTHDARWQARRESKKKPND